MNTDYNENGVLLLPSVTESHEYEQITNEPSVALSSSTFNV